MADKQDELAEEVITEVFNKIDLPKQITKTEKFELEIRIDTSEGKSIIKYDLKAVAEWMINKNKNKFSEYWKESGEDDQDVYFSLYNSFVIDASISALEILIQQLPLEFEDLIQTLPQLAIKLDEFISNEYQKQIFDDIQLSEVKDSKKDIGKFISASSKNRKQRMIKAVALVKEESKPKLSDFAIHYEKLLPVWQQAKKVYKQVRKSKTWRESIKSAFSENELPNDLIERLDSLDIYEASTSAIALEHSARICGTPPNTYQLRRLNQINAESRKIHGLTTAKGPKPKVQ